MVVSFQDKEETTMLITSNTIQQRKRAVQLYYYQHWTKAAICRHLHCSRPWLDRWLARYDPDDVEGSLQDRPSGPHQANSPWSEEIRQQAEEMRRQRMQREQWPYALYGAATIHYEFEQLQGSSVPPTRTIHRWLVKAGLVSPHPASPPSSSSHFTLPIPCEDVVNWRQQLDFKGPFYVHNSPRKYYIIVLRDCWSHRCALQALDSREAMGIVRFLAHRWTWLGVPVYLQMDNAIEFQGSPRSPRSFGQVVCLAIHLGVEPVFNPPGEPWFNGGIERYNGFLEDRFSRLDCADFPAFEREVQACQTACNATHRVAALQGYTPNEIAATACLRLLSPTYHRYEHPLSQSQGFVSFIRRVRKSGRITLGPHDRFMVDPTLVSTYVWARADLARHLVTIAQPGHLLKTYDYSAETVGRWAYDEPDEGNA
jgi:putative transposase